MGEFIFNKSNIYLNSKIENPQDYFSEKTKPVRARIMDAWFDRKGEYLNFITGFYQFHFTKQKIELKVDAAKHILEEYSNVILNLMVMEDTTPKKGIIHLEVKSIEEILQILKTNENKDSCIPLLNKYTDIYRQTINGQDVIGFSDMYISTNYTSSDKTTNSNQSNKKKKSGF